MAWRKPNVSTDVRSDHFGPNRNPPHGVKPSEVPQPRDEGGRPVGASPDLVGARPIERSRVQNRKESNMRETNYPQKDEPKLVFLSRPAPGQKYEDWVDSLIDELFKPGGLADGKIVQLRANQFPGGN